MPINRIALYHLETLQWIARLGTFGAAAERLNTTQPTISARVRELESHLGVQLFRRDGRTMTLTPAGRQFVRESEPIMARFSSIIHGSNDVSEASGIIRIGAGEIAAASCLPGFVTELHKELPNVALEIEIALTADLIQHLLTGKTDLVFGAGRIAHPALQATPIGTVDLLWLSSPAVVASMEDGASTDAFPLWSLSNLSPLYQIMKEAIAKSGLSFHSVNLCNNARSMIDIVMSGNGVGIFPHSMVQRELREKRLMPFPGAMEIPAIEFQVAVKAGETDPLILEIFRRASKLDIGLTDTPIPS
ncbi:MAG: LysR family transcriptional regulator [Sphingobium sp.]|nr:LysR family transcriptional regulator [Sphingobium sp.]MCP5400234.1 LysR family transcriptional regulator [Sphingomonas sp.]